MVSRMNVEELEAFRRSFGGKNQRMELKANMAYLRRHYRQLLKDHPNHWVIITGGGGQVILEKDSEKFEQRLEETRSTGAVSHFLADPKPIMLI